MRGLVILLLSLGAFAAAPPVQDELVITREKDPLYHRPGCPVVRDAKDVLAMTRAQANGRGKKPHPQCDPANTPQTAEERKRAEALATPLFIATGDRYYHREKCAKLGKAPRRVSLDEAAKKHFPCRTCKPPVRPRPKR